MSKRTLKGDKYALLIAEAEAAVAAVKDPTLKQPAFVTILGALLHTDGGLSHVSAPSTSSNRRKERAAPGGRGPMTYVQEVVDAGFFQVLRTIGDVKSELSNRGHHIPLTSLSGPLQRLVQRKVLRRHKRSDGNKDQYAYSNY